MRSKLIPVVTEVRSPARSAALRVGGNLVRRGNAQS
jgi:hypothetical protein